METTFEYVCRYIGSRNRNLFPPIIIIIAVKRISFASFFRSVLLFERHLFQLDGKYLLLLHILLQVKLICLVVSTRGV